MIVQSLIGPRKSKCDVPSGTTQGWACLRVAPKAHGREGTRTHNSKWIFY
jgi:hypothetical protein